MLSYTYIINKNKNMNELNLKPSADAKDSGTKKKIYIAVGVLAAVAILAWAVFIAPSSGTQGFIRAGDPYSGSAQPPTNIANPFSGSAQPPADIPNPFKRSRR